MPGGNEEDLALCRRAAAGDSGAFSLLVSRHEARLRSFLERMGGRDLADDVAQEAFLRAWRFARQYDGAASFATWLTRIAWRCYLDIRRRRQPSVPTVAMPAEGGAHGLEIEDMLSRLSESERAALILCEGHGWSHGDAARLLDMPLGTLKSAVARAKAKCRAMWSEHD